MNKYKIFNAIDSRWLRSSGPEDDIVISSRVRLARNVKDYAFPNRLTLQEERELLTKISTLPKTEEENGFGDLSFIDLSVIPKEEKSVLVEKHLISPQLAFNEGACGLLINEDETVAIMINEEDHFRIQTILPGLELEQAYEKSSAADDMINRFMDISFDEQYGYLTACPSNTGTGMRASVMLHLPMLVQTGQIKRVLSDIRNYGFVCRGLYGEGTNCKGNLVQISNQMTLGLPEEEILRRLKTFVLTIIGREREIRDTMMQQERIHIEDKVFRAEALLLNAKLLDEDETFSLLSDLRLGIDLGILPNYDKRLFSQLIIYMQPLVLEKLHRGIMNKTEEKQFRGELIKEKLQGGM